MFVKFLHDKIKSVNLFNKKFSFISGWVPALFFKLYLFWSNHEK